MKITVFNSSGTQIGSGTNSVSLSGLSDGTYSVTLYSYNAWTINSRAGASYSFNGSFGFVVDTTPPTITNASTSKTYYKNTAFTVKASDSGTGLKALFYKAPGTTAWTTLGASKTVSLGSTNGLYSFYAEDNAGNQTSTYYVFFDDTNPTGVFCYESGTTISGYYTNSPFYFQVTDSGSGVDTLYYFHPENGSQTGDDYTNGAVISSSAEDGTYYFLAKDKAGNSISASMIYDKTDPVGTLYAGDTVVASGKTVNASSVKFTVSDALSGVNSVYVLMPGASAYTAYTSGTALTDNGTYIFYAMDKAGNRTTNYKITLDTQKPTLSCSGASLNGTATDSFTASATDNIGTPTLYYKSPSMSSYVSCTNGMSISKTESNGVYSFYAVDGAGNQSSVATVTLNIPDPTAVLTRGMNGQDMVITWSDSSCTGKLNGSSYTSGTWVKTEGSYTFVITSTANRSKTYTFTVSHVYNSSVISPTCLKEGYTKYTCEKCGASYTANTTSALGHNYITSVVAPTCTTQGYTLHVCSRCGDSYKDTYTEKSEHTYGGWVTTTEATCTSSGEQKRVCTVCGEYETRSISALGHNYVGTVTKPTCVLKGYTTHVCTRCTATYVDSYVDAKGHAFGSWKVTKTSTCTEKGELRRDCNDCDYYETKEVAALGHNYTTTITSPTCTAKGYTTHTCSRCSASYIDTYTAALGHNYGAWVQTIAPTCTADGQEKHICARCDTYETRAVSPLGHNYVATVTEPTCIKQGYTTHQCSRCSNAYVDSYTSPLGHDYEVTTVAPTCTEDGYDLNGCTRCDDNYKSNYVSKLGHDYIENRIEVTCTEEGCLLHTCIRCGDEYKTDVVTPIGHQYETKVLLTATCTENGLREFCCSLCGDTYQKEIAATGHDFKIEETSKDGNNIVRTYTCTTCGYSETQEMGEEYEKVTNYMTYLFEQYSPYMLWVFLATSGVWSIVMGVALIIAKKNEDAVKAKKMLANYIIGMVAIFVILVAAPLLMKGIAALVS